MDGAAGLDAAPGHVVAHLLAQAVAVLGVHLHAGRPAVVRAAPVHGHRAGAGGVVRQQQRGAEAALDVADVVPGGLAAADIVRVQAREARLVEAEVDQLAVVPEEVEVLVAQPVLVVDLEVDLGGGHGHQPALGVVGVEHQLEDGVEQLLVADAVAVDVIRHRHEVQPVGPGGVSDAEHRAAGLGGALPHLQRAPVPRGAGVHVKIAHIEELTAEGLSGPGREHQGGEQHREDPLEGRRRRGPTPA